MKYLKDCIFLLSVFVLMIGSIHAQNEKTPAWVKDLIVYEVSTKSFNSPKIPERGTFKSVREKIPYMQKLGINAIWLTGNSWADSKHFYNIWSQYAVIRQDSIDTSLGTRKEMRALIAEAHKHGIRVFLDVITHGVMSYSPLVKEHPDWFKGGSWGMTDFDWQGGHADLDEWWVKTFTDYVVNDGVDGFRLDVDIYRPDLWKRIRQNAVEAGHPICIMSENLISCRNAVDCYQRSNKLSEQTMGLDYSNASLTDMAAYFDESQQFLKNWRETDKIQQEEPDSTIYTVQLSSHDDGWDSFPAQDNPYVAEGSRCVFGYSCLFSPMIPIFMSGEEFDADFVPIPRMKPDLFGKAENNNGTWLYGSWIDWSQLKLLHHKQMLDDVTRMIAIRKANPDIFYGRSMDNPVEIVSVDMPENKSVPKPYLLYAKGSKAILIAGNPTGQTQVITCTVPKGILGFNKQDKIMVRDLWNGTGFATLLSADGTLTFTIAPDRTYRGGVAVFELTAGSSSFF